MLILAIEANHSSSTLWFKFSHRYLKKSRLIKFFYVPATSTWSSKGIFAEATNRTNQTNKAGGMHN